MNIILRTIYWLCLLASYASNAESLSAEGVTSDYQFFVTAWQGEIDIRPSVDDTIHVNVNCPNVVGAATEINDRGLRVISSGQNVSELRKSDDKVTFRAPKGVGMCATSITAPPSVRTQVRINDSGKITISNWRAMVTAWSAGGDVTLNDQRAPFSVTAMNGDASIEYRGETLAADSAITAANGIVALSLSAEPPMTLRTQARWGEVATDLDVVFTREQIDNASWSVASLAGGGPVVTLRNLNSDIVVTNTD